MLAPILIAVSREDDSLLPFPAPARAMAIGPPPEPVGNTRAHPDFGHPRASPGGPLARTGTPALIWIDPSSHIGGPSFTALFKSSESPGPSIDG